MAAAKHILWYLKGVFSFDLHLTWDSTLSLHGFTNADWVGSIVDQKSAGGYIYILDKKNLNKGSNILIKLQQIDGYIINVS